VPKYESVFIARQDISAAQVDGLSETFEKVITDAGGSIAKRENWGLRTMAYKIKKNRKGHYVLMNIDGPAPALHEMERQMRINEDILRYMSLRVDEFEEGPSAITRNKDRDDRPRRGGDRGPRRDFGGDRPNKPDDAPKPNDAPAAAPAVDAAPAAEETSESKGDEA
jgi:small subunit ribosomal protein S6